VYFGCNDGLIHCVDASTGGKVWSYDTSQAAFNTEVQVIASPAIANGRLYVGSTNFVFFCLGDASAPTTGPR
jgi:outer membrane protein assembly factor BamB